MVVNYTYIGWMVKTTIKLAPWSGNKPLFVQLYVHSTESKIENKISYLKTDQSNVDRIIINGMGKMLDKNNVLVGSFWMVRDCYKS